MGNEEKKKSDFLKTQSSIVWWKERRLRLYLVRGRISGVS
jgi:hypothetical protein